jgi:NAD(P)-dependent dehydrogenase (short-subunit alcohol dehydrogenase family)
LIWAKQPSGLPPASLWRIGCCQPAKDRSAPQHGNPCTVGEAGARRWVKHPPTPEEIAGPILFLASDLSNFMTGEILNVNGGSVLCG